MALALTEEQQILQSTAREFHRGECAPSRTFEVLRDGKGRHGVSREISGPRWRSSVGRV